MGDIRDMERQDEQRALLMLVMHIEGMTKDLFGDDSNIITPLKTFKHALIQELVEGGHSSFDIEK